MKYFLLLLVAAIWGSTFIVIKDSLTVFSPFALLTIRFFIASILLYIWVKAKGLNPLSFLKYGIITGIAQFLTYAPQTIGLKYTTPTNSAFITGMFVVFTPIFGLIINRRKLSRLDIVAILLAIFGLWIITGGISHLNVGDLVTLVTAMAIGLHIVLTVNALKKGADPMVITFQQLLITAIISFLLSLFLKESIFVSNPSSYLSLVYLGVFASFVAYGIQNTMLKTVNPVLAAIILSTEPLFALLFSWVLRYENFNVFKLFGGILILLAIVLPDLTTFLSKKEVTSKSNGV